jgi:hypothetical protein
MRRTWHVLASVHSKFFLTMMEHLFPLIFFRQIILSTSWSIYGTTIVLQETGLV